MKNLKFFLSLLGLVLMPVIVNSQSSIRERLLAEYSAYCLNYQQSELFAPEEAFYELCAGRLCQVIVDVIDTSYLKCRDRPLGFCGSGGCEINFIVDGTNFTEMGWAPISIEYYETFLILLKVSGINCGNVPNGSPCFKALSWDQYENRFNSIDQ